VAGIATFFSLAYAVLDKDPPTLTMLYIYYAPFFAVVGWLTRDVRGTWLAGLADLGFLSGFCWPVLLPWYASHRYRPVAWSLASLLIGVVILPQLTVIVIGILWMIQSVRRWRLTSV
jgi:hypothetical protein